MTVACAKSPPAVCPEVCHGLIQTLDPLFGRAGRGGPPCLRSRALSAQGRGHAGMNEVMTRSSGRHWCVWAS